MNLLLSRGAERDLRDIFSYSEREFGRDQAQRYLEQINARIRVIVASPNVGRRFDEIDDDMRLVGCVSHNIYFRVIGDELRVVRILHQAMDAPHHLG